MVLSSGMGQKCVHPEAASKTYDSKVVHESVKIMDTVMKWLRTQDDKDGPEAIKVYASKHHEYLAKSREYSKKGKCRVMTCDYVNKSFVETVEKHGEEWRESHLMDYLNIGRVRFPVPGGEDDGRLMCYVNAPYVMQMNMVRYAGVELTMNEFPVVVRGKRKLNTKSLTESELIGVSNMMSIMLWIRNFLLKQEERIEVDLLLGNKSPSPKEQGNQTPSLKRAMYVNVRLVNITMGNKCSVNPMVCKWLLLNVTCEGVVSKCCIKEFGAIIKIEVSRTTGVCWGLYSVGYCSSSVVHPWPLQVEPGDCRLDKFGTWRIIKEKGSSQIGAAPLRLGASVDGDKPCNTSTITDFPVLITQEVS
jgi:hypothetical protein